ncbi:MAG: RnfABCDGE type electron transport complex subunit D [Massilibacteroides sp.]|nr:RnfABCDGE type electron transport complex subunit D [Massilibacteroides sp.]MDD3061724.1 RnfABCDGE type electron transport complex subunit D [Massilibacteroides sp.]MDD4115154.1 RnfABCDGE type electron transport complex subunit D [Massilibacteroides sp.]MDD4660607.1 RnfABCDGE type electron transport complex subunit D [Massilibacteroides sp.]
MENNLIISPSPHIHSGDTVSKNMYGVLIALLPALLVSLYYFGLGALIVTAVSIASCILFEYLIQKILFKQQPSISDGSAILTGLLLAFNLPSNLPVWIIIIGALAAIGIGKMSFGGLGNNIFNPALVGRVFLLISFPAQMTTWPIPGNLPMTYTDGQTGATVLSLLNEGVKNLPSYTDMFLGKMGGSLGEVSAVALLIGFVFLLIRKIITWHIPVSIIVTTFLFTGIMHWVNPTEYAHPLVHVLSGGLLLGAIFMATDYVTSPMSKNGMVVFGIGIGLLTSVIRLFGAYPEGMSFAILIMNALTPLINIYFKPKHFGGK